MPDTWKNIAWVIQNSIEVLKEQTLDIRYLVEQVKVYNTDNHIAHLKRTHALSEKRGVEDARLQIHIDATNERLERTAKDLTIDYNKNIDFTESRV